MLHRLLLLAALSPLSSLASCAPPRAIATQLVSAPLTTLAGNPTSLENVSKGRVTVVALWATWCDACKVEMPAILRLEAKARLRGDFDVVTIAVGDDPQTVRAFSSNNRVPSTVLVDPDFTLAGTARDRVPTTLVLDHEGRIVHEGGALDAVALEVLRQELGP